ncbi:MAG: hypothetical protein Q7U57_09500 [Methylovulum sp.]|nr:hypothetical protein [Methylovulum sp.]
MQTYLTIIENNLGGSVIFAAVGVFIASMLLCLLISARYRNKLAKADIALKNERVAYEQERMQSSDGLNAAHEKIQQQEAALTAQADRIEQIEHEKQAAQAVAARVAILEEENRERNRQVLELLDTLEREWELDADTADAGDLWQRLHVVIAALGSRLHTEQRRCAEMEQILLAGQTMLAEKETALEELTSAVDGQVALLAEAEQAFDEQLNTAQLSLAKLQAKYLAYKRYFGRLAWGRMRVFNDLNIAAQRLHQLESSLAGAHAVEPVIQQQENQYEEIHEVRFEAQPDEVREELQDVAPEEPAEVPVPVDGVKPANRLFARFVNAVKTDFGIDKHNVAKDDASGEDEEPQSEDELAVVSAALNDADVPVTALPVSELDVVDGQESLLAKPSAISTAVEKAAHLPQELKSQLFSLFKKQALSHEGANGSEQVLPESVKPDQEPDNNEVLPKSELVPGQLKGLYRKMAAFTHKG